MLRQCDPLANREDRSSIQSLRLVRLDNGLDSDFDDCLERTMPAKRIFVDRVDERKILERLVESARRGESGALVVYGDAGMGKTALLDLAVSLTNLPNIRISGVQAEQAFGFAALHRLLVPCMRQVEMLPPPQRKALETAFGRRQESPPDRFMVGLAALSVLAAEASGSGLLCVIDDAQWIDVESLQSLAFLGRRMWAEGIVLLFGVRTHLGLPPDLAGIPTLEVSGIPYEPAVDLLSHAAGRSMPLGVAQRVIGETGGCPLALWELGGELAKTSATDHGPPMERLTISHRLEEHFFQQIDGLPSDTQLLLLIAAADTPGDRALVWKVARDLGVGVDAHKEAEHQRILLPGPELRFRHPLIRSAVYARADPQQRRVVHRALAETMGRGAFPDRWAGHVALGAAGPSEHLAAELEATSQMAQARGGYSAQANLLVQAANLSESLEKRSIRLLSAAAAALNAGVHPYAAELLDQAEPHLSEPVDIAEAQHLRGRLTLRLPEPPKAPALLLAAARSFLPLSMRRTREVLLEAFDAYAISGRFTLEISPEEIASVAEETSATPGVLTLQDHLLDGTKAFFGASRFQAYEHYRKAAQLLRSGEVTDDQIALWSTFGCWVATEMFDDSTYNILVARADAHARQNGALLVLLFNLFAQMNSDVRAGRLRAATGRHAEIIDVAAAIGLPAEIYPPMDDIVRAWAGDEEGTQAATAASIEVNSAVGVDTFVVGAHFALAVLHIGARRYQDALGETEYILAQNVLGYPAQALPLAVEAAVRSGQIEKAHQALADLESRAVMSGTPWALGLLARSRALLTDSPEAEKYFHEAIRLLQQTSVATDVARARLLYGEWLRREKRRVEARTQLRMAHDYFAEIGATSFAKRAEIELLATGERARSRSIQRGETLTPQERRVAELAADGLSNIDIASQLFISSATVQYHLRNVYRKLDVRSRVLLGNALRTQGFAPSI
jgi:DNA-binding CsgD family transcriptional regulator